MIGNELGMMAVDKFLKNGTIGEILPEIAHLLSEGA
jgi:hypothetical protein